MTFQPREYAKPDRHNPGHSEGLASEKHSLQHPKTQITGEIEDAIEDGLIVAQASGRLKYHLCLEDQNLIGDSILSLESSRLGQSEDAIEQGISFALASGKLKFYLCPEDQRLIRYSIISPRSSQLRPPVNDSAIL